MTIFFAILVIWRNWSRWEWECPQSWRELLLSTTFLININDSININYNLWWIISCAFHTSFVFLPSQWKIFYLNINFYISKHFQRNIMLIGSQHVSWSILSQMEQLSGDSNYLKDLQWPLWWIVAGVSDECLQKFAGEWRFRGRDIVGSRENVASSQSCIECL